MILTDRRLATARIGAGILAILMATASAGCAQSAPGASLPSSSAPVGGSPTATGTPAGTDPGTGDPVAAARADLQNLVGRIERSHLSLFDFVPQAEWRSAVDRLDRLMPELVPNEPERLMVEFMRLVALPGVHGGRHGHVSARRTETAPALGIVTYTFADGIYVTRAQAANQDLVGGRLVAIAGRPIAEVRALVEPLVPRDNEWTVEVWLGDYLRQPDVLLGLGIVDAVGPVEVTVADAEGTETTRSIGLVGSAVDLVPEQPLPDVSWLSEGDHEFVALHYLPERPEMLWTSRTREALWWTTIDDGATVYVQQNLVEPPPQDTLDAIIDAAGGSDVKRVILDIRHNLGGNDPTRTRETFQDAAINGPGRLYLLTSNNVFSAATFIADELDRFSDAVLVGEPIGGAPGFIVGGSTLRLDDLPIPLTVDIPGGAPVQPGTLLTVVPDIAVPLVGADYFADRDAALQAIPGR